jgi:hypothetical protein
LIYFSLSVTSDFSSISRFFFNADYKNIDLNSKNHKKNKKYQANLEDQILIALDRFSDSTKIIVVDELF